MCKPLPQQDSRHDKCILQHPLEKLRLWPNCKRLPCLVRSWSPCPPWSVYCRDTTRPWAWVFLGRCTSGWRFHHPWPWPAITVWQTSVKPAPRFPSKAYPTDLWSPCRWQIRQRSRHDKCTYPSTRVWSPWSLGSICSLALRSSPVAWTATESYYICVMNCTIKSHFLFIFGMVIDANISGLFLLLIFKSSIILLDHVCTSISWILRKIILLHNIFIDLWKCCWNKWTLMN